MALLVPLTQKVIWAIAIILCHYLFVCSCHLSLSIHILIVSSKTSLPIGTKLCRNYVFEVFYKIPHFVLIWLTKHDHHRLIGWNFKNKNSLNLLMQMVNDIQNVCEVLYKASSFRLHLAKIYGPFGNFYLWFFETFKIIHVLMICNIVEVMYVKSSTKVHHFVLFWWKTWWPWAQQICLNPKECINNQASGSGSDESLVFSDKNYLCNIQIWVWNKIKSRTFLIFLIFVVENLRYLTKL